MREKREHLFIPDTQCEPGAPLEHLSAAGEFALEHQPDVIIHIGDHWDFPSLSKYEEKGSKYFEGLRYSDDVEAGKEGMRRFLRPIWQYNKKHSKWKKRKYEPRMIFTLGNHCLSPDTEVLTYEGWKAFEEISLSDYIFTKNDNGEGVWKKPLSVFSRSLGDNERMYESPVQGCRMLVSEGHRVFYWVNGGEKVKEAKDAPRTFDVEVALPSGCGVDLSDEEVQLVGWMLTDSSIKKNRIVFYQRKSNAHKITQVLDNLGIEYWYKERERNIESVCGKTLKEKPEISVEIYVEKADSLKWKEFLSIDETKSFPYWTHHLDDNQFSIFLDTLIEADGSRFSENVYCFYGEKRICDALMACCVEHNTKASISEYRPGHFRVNINGKRNRQRVDGFTESDNRPDWVWCLEIENGNFMVRRGDRSFLTGNCHRITRAINSDPKLEGTIGLEDLCLTEFGWEWYNFLEIVEVDDILYSHYFVNPDSNTGNPITGTIDNKLRAIGQSFSMGHQQRLQYGIRYTAKGQPVQGIVCGAFYQQDMAFLGPQANRHHFRGIIYKHEVSEGTYDPMFVSLDYLLREYT